MNLIKVMAVVTLAIVLLGCPKKKEEVVTEPVKAPTETQVEANTEVAENSGLTAEQIERQRLEARAKEIEAMINKIMENDVYFEYDKSTLTEEARDLLSKVADILIAEQEFEVLVEGHTDERGTASYNLSLGGKRAMSVKKFLISYGVKQARIQTMSFGQEKPKVEGSSEEAYQQNRRANFRVRVK